MAWALGRAQPPHSACVALFFFSFTAKGQSEHLHPHPVNVRRFATRPPLAFMIIWTWPSVNKVLWALLAGGAMLARRVALRLPDNMVDTTRIPQGLSREAAKGSARRGEVQRAPTTGAPRKQTSMRSRETSSKEPRAGVLLEISRWQRT